MRYWIYFFFFLVTASPSIAQFSAGIFGSYDNSKLSGDIPKEYVYELRPGFAIGLQTKTRIGKEVFLNIRPNYTMNGARINQRVEDDAVVAPAGFSEEDSLLLFPISHEHIAIPILFQVFVTRVFYGIAGFDGSYNFRSLVEINDQKIDVTDQTNDLILHAVFGFGFDFPIKRTVLGFEVSYAQGLNTFTKLEDIDSGDSPRLRTQRYRLSMHFLFFQTRKKP